MQKKNIKADKEKSNNERTHERHEIY